MAIDTAKYVARIGYDGPLAPTLETLRGLVLRHVDAIPFENLDPLVGKTVALDVDALVAKMIDQRRGGYCFEQNRLLAEVLGALGFEVTTLAGRVLWTLPPGTITPRSHMVLRVELDDGPRIVDVGFGGVSLTGPLRLVVDEPQDTPHERFRLVRHEGDFVVEIEIAGAWEKVYRFDLSRQTPADYEVSSWYLCNNPRSPFRRELRVARATRDARLSLRDKTLTLHKTNGRREQRTLASADEIRTTLTETFGLDVPLEPAMDDALERAAQAS